VLAFTRRTLGAHRRKFEFEQAMLRAMPVILRRGLGRARTASGTIDITPVRSI